MPCIGIRPLALGTLAAVLCAGCAGPRQVGSQEGVAAGHAGTSTTRSSRRDLQTEANKAVLLRAHRDAWSKGDLQAVEDVYDKDCIGHFNWGQRYQGVQEVKNRVSGIHKTYPDWTETVTEIVAEGDWVATRWTSTGTHSGFENPNAKGKKISIAEMGMFRVQGGKIVELWGLWDFEDLKRQLGQ